MDDVTRGYIESVMDDILKEDVLKDIEWTEKEIPISSMKDLVIGYLCGILDAFAVLTASTRARKGVTENDMNEIRGMVKRRLPEIVQKVERELHR